MRCLVLGGDLGRGGAERQAVLAAYAMSTAGIGVRLFVCQPPLDQLADARGLGVEVDAPLRREHVATQLERLASALRAFEPDAVVTFLTSAGVRYGIVRSLTTAARRPAWLYSVRGNYTSSEAIRLPIRSAIRQACLRAADRVVVNSPSLAANTLATAPFTAEKLEIVSNVLLPFESDAGVGRRALADHVGDAPATPLIGAIGLVRDERNYPLLVRAFAIVRRHHPGGRLVIVGRSTGAECARAVAVLRRACRDAGVADCVVLAGEIAEAHQLAATFDVFVVSSMLEGSSNALAEAIVGGAAIASTPVADAAELLGEGGVVASGWTADALANAILRVLEDPAAWRAAAARRRVRLLEMRSPQAVGAQWVRVLHGARPVDR